MVGKILMYQLPTKSVINTLEYSPVVFQRDSLWQSIEEYCTHNIKYFPIADSKSFLLFSYGREF